MTQPPTQVIAEKRKPAGESDKDRADRLCRAMDSILWLCTSSSKPDSFTRTAEQIATHNIEQFNHNQVN